MEIVKQIEPVSKEKLARIRAMSAYSLPINPSERGLTPEQIKARFYAPIIGQSLSVLTELGRVIKEVNGVIGTLETLLAGRSVGDGEETKALEDLILLSKQGQTLKEFAATLEDVRRSVDEIFAASEEASKAANEALDAKEGAEEARDDILSMNVSSIPVAWSECPSVKKSEVGGVVQLAFSLPMGRPFTIARTFSSVEEMNVGAASDGVEDGQYVMVNTGNVNDEETARLYFKQGGAYHFLIDLSGAAGVTPVRGVDYFTSEDIAYFDAHIDEQLGEVDDALDAIFAIQESLINGDSNVTPLPDYWESYLPNKVTAIKELQDEGGKDCFSFVVMTDMHYPSNLGKRSPLLAKKILDKCDIKYALCLGDTQTRGCHSTKESLLEENAEIEKMLSPIRDRLLQTQGNHDGSYGWLDRDGDGKYSNQYANGETKPIAERESYVYNLTTSEMHSTIYRKVGLVGDVFFDESESGYYIDDVANKVRYIVMNTNCNDYELREDGTAKYPTMWLFNFTQKQFDLVIEALNNIPSASWSVVVAGHCPLTQEIGDRVIMQGVLNAYKNKTTYRGEYAGVAEGGPAYTNRAEPLPNNTTDTSKWVNGYRFSSSGISEQSGTTLSNAVSCKKGDVIRIKGVTLSENTHRIGLDVLYGENTSASMCYGYFNNGIEDVVTYNGLENGVYTFTLNADYGGTVDNFRFAMPTPTDASAVIITLNEEIVDGGTSGYDAVAVDCDFSNAKGELVGYFAGHTHNDSVNTSCGFNIITTRSDAKEENADTLKNERVVGTTTEQSFDVFTVNKAKRKIYATKIGAGTDREISY